jgi:3-deoxy-manno-octulosonate cytidylyltransferase (CMP-KDO synthetase)
MTASADFVVAIPARYAASRLPGKPLRMLGGEPLVLHVARRALAAGAREVWVATDDARIADALAGSGVRIAMTAADHVSGTDRLAECARIAGWEADTVVVNLQGDEPFAPASGIRTVAEVLVASGAPMSTLATAIEDAATLFDPNAVKLVRAASGDALYFSRAPIPWARDAFAAERSSLAAPHRHLRLPRRVPDRLRGAAAVAAGADRGAGTTARAGSGPPDRGRARPRAVPARGRHPRGSGARRAPSGRSAGSGLRCGC